MKLRGVKVGVTIIKYKPNDRMKRIITIAILKNNAAILLIFAFNVDFTTNISANPKIKCRYTLFAPPQSLYIVYM